MLASISRQNGCFNQSQYTVDHTVHKHGQWAPIEIYVGWAT